MTFGAIISQKRYKVEIQIPTAGLRKEPLEVLQRHYC